MKKLLKSEFKKSKTPFSFLNTKKKNVWKQPKKIVLIFFYFSLKKKINTKLEIYAEWKSSNNLESPLSILQSFQSFRDSIPEKYLPSEKATIESLIEGLLIQEFVRYTEHADKIFDLIKNKTKEKLDKGKKALCFEEFFMNLDLITKFSCDKRKEFEF